MILENKKIYKIEGHPLNGIGLKVFEDGSSYLGGWKDGKFHGFGIHKLANNNRYEGDFKNGVCHG